VGADAGTVVERIRVPGDTGAGPRRLVSKVGGRTLEVVHDADGTRITLHHSWAAAGSLWALFWTLLIAGVCALLLVSLALDVADHGARDDAAAIVIACVFLIPMGLWLALVTLPVGAMLACGAETVEARGRWLAVTQRSFLRKRRRTWDVGDGVLVLAPADESRFIALLAWHQTQALVGRSGGLGLANNEGVVVWRFGLYVGHGAARRLVEGLGPVATD